MKTPPIRRLLSTVRRWRRRKAAIRELKTLDDRLLKDIGLRRYEIESVVEMNSWALRRPQGPTARLSVKRCCKAQGASQVGANDESRLAA